MSSDEQPVVQQGSNGSADQEAGNDKSTKTSTATAPAPSTRKSRYLSGGRT